MKELFYYTAGWCQHCQALSPTLEDIGRQIPVRTQNVDYVDPAVLTEAKVKNIPTVVLVENGQEIKRFVGVKSHSEIINWLNG
jgi:thioredoxin-like negative regulator of GroEL